MQISGQNREVLNDFLGGKMMSVVAEMKLDKGQRAVLMRAFDDEIEAWVMKSMRAPKLGDRMKANEVIVVMREFKDRVFA